MGLGTQKNFLLSENCHYLRRFKKYCKAFKLVYLNYSAVKLGAEAIENGREAHRRLLGRVKLPVQVYQTILQFCSLRISKALGAL